MTDTTREPTDEEILDLAQEHNISYSLIDGSVMRGDALSFARAVLAACRPKPQSMTELSPAAQAVLDAYWKSPWDPSLQHEDRYAIAAALRAAADQVLAVEWEGRIEPDAMHRLGINWTRDALHAIAAELEAQ